MYTTTPAGIAEAVLRRLEDAWNAGDGDAYGAEYRDTATFVNIQGEFIRGVDAIAAGHSDIFATIYAGSRNHFELLNITEIGDDVIVATSRSTLQAPHGPLAGTNYALSTNILVRDGDDWKIAAAHNTLVRPR